MKKSLAFSGVSFLLLLVCSFAAYAVPGTINYQGVLTDSVGAALSGEYQITFSLYADETGGEPVWIEIQTVTVSGGIYTVQLGSSTLLDSVDFSAPYWLEVAVGAETLSPRQALTSVPYAMRAQYADGVAANSNFTLGTQWISGDGDDEGIFVDSDGRVGVGVNPTTANLEVTGDNGVLFGGTYDQGSIPVEGAGTRLMWYPGKGAFRVGRVWGTQWDDVRVGQYSTALGVNTVAIGEVSTALGNTTVASGVNSTTMGYYAVASGETSTAIGNTTTANGVNSTAIGYNTAANGDISTAIGNTTTANGINSTAMGLRTIAIGNYSVAMGIGTEPESFVETSLGSYDTGYTPFSTNAWNEADRLFVVGNGSAAIARSDALVMLKNGNTTINGSLRANSFNGALISAVGTSASGEYSAAMGMDSTASGNRSTALGVLTTASGYAAVAIGNQNTASGGSSTAMGSGTTASGDVSTTLGTGTRAESYAETVIGQYDTDYVPSNTNYGYAPTDRLFVIGNGMSVTTRSDAMVVLKSGDTTINGDLEISGTLSGNGSGLTNLDWGDLDNVPAGFSDGVDNTVSSVDGLSGGTINGATTVSGQLNLSGNLIFATGSDRRINLPDNTKSLFIGHQDVQEGPYSMWLQSSNYMTFTTGGHERMRIIAGGNVGIGTTTPTSKLHVAGNITEDSDERLKINIQPIDSALYKIGQLEGVSFDWRDTEKYDDRNHLGVLAQQVEGVFPEVVFTADDEMQTKSVDYIGLIAPLIEAVKELKAQNEVLQAQNTEYLSRLEALERKLP